MQATLAAIQQASQNCLQDGVEGGFACCAAALDTWNNYVVKDVEQKQTTMKEESYNTDRNTNATTTSKTSYSAISTHHLLDHKPDNLLRSAGNKCKLNGYFKFGNPGIALVWHSTSDGDNDSSAAAFENFVNTLKSAMPQKKFQCLFTKPWNSSQLPSGWNEISTAGDLKVALQDLGIPEEDYYTVLGLDPKTAAATANDGGDTSNNIKKGKKKGGRSKK
jgi:hypothetical protein